MEDSARRLLGMEVLESERFKKIYASAMKSLNLQISTMSGEGTMDEARLRLLRAQLEAAFKGIEKRNLKEMREAARMMLRQASEDAEVEVNQFEKYFLGVHQRIPWRAIKISLKKNTFLINNFASSLESYDASVRAQMEKSLSESLIKRNSYRQAKLDLQLQLGQIQEWKLGRIVRTELHNLYGMSKTMALGETKDAYLPDLKKALFHPMDSRTGDDSKKADDMNLVAEIDEPFRYTWKGEERVFMTSDRPQDRAIIIPYRARWAKAEPQGEAAFF